MKAWLSTIWQTMKRPATQISLGVVSLGAFISGIIFWGGFNTALEVTNTEEFCISCHEMRDNVYQELQQTVHWSNHSGVRATCPDCHVPYNWTDKIARKMQASKEVWGAIFGTIDTREKFEAKRLTLAQHEWARFKANGSLECKNCHDYDSMNWDLMSDAARTQMKQAHERDQSCMDCHKGIAHQLPKNMNAGAGLLGPLDQAASSTQVSSGSDYYNHRVIPVYLDQTLQDSTGKLNAGSKIKVTQVTDQSYEIEIAAWRKAKGFGRVLYQDFGKNILVANLDKALAQDKKRMQTSDTKEDELTGLPWQQATVKVWIAKETLLADTQQLWSEASEIYNSSCSTCHSQPAEAHFDANTWPGMFKGMLSFVNFDNDTQALVLKYLQTHSSDYSDAHH